MAPLEIHVTGDGTTYHPAECGILTLQARTKPFSTAQEADNMVASTMNSLCDAIAPYCSYDATTGSTTVDAAIAHYSLTTFETTRGHERLQDGSSMSFSKSSRYETTYTASAQLTIEFRDFALLARLATQIGSMENVKIKSLEWGLTSSTLADVESQARKEATMKAIRKARDYAEGFGGLSDDEAVRKVKAVLVKEAVPYTKVTKAKLHFGKVNSEMTQKSEWDYEPKEVGIEVKVDGRFVVHE